MASLILQNTTTIVHNISIINAYAINWTPLIPFDKRKEKSYYLIHRVDIFPH